MIVSLQAASRRCWGRGKCPRMCSQLFLVDRPPSPVLPNLSSQYLTLPIILYLASPNIYPLLILSRGGEPKCRCGWLWVRVCDRGLPAYSHQPPSCVTARCTVGGREGSLAPQPPWPEPSHLPPPSPPTLPTPYLAGRNPSVLLKPNATLADCSQRPGHEETVWRGGEECITGVGLNFGSRTKEMWEVSGEQDKPENVLVGHLRWQDWPVCQAQSEEEAEEVSGKLSLSHWGRCGADSPAPS